MSSLLSPEKISEIKDLIISNAPKVIGALAILFIGLWMVGKLTRVLEKQFKRVKMDESLSPFLLSMLSALMKVVVFLAAASMVGFKISSLMAILAAMAFAVGMALQGSLGNFAGGVLLLLLKPFKVGDKITAMGFTGDVEEIQIFNTILITNDNRQIILPNGTLQTSAIENITVKEEIGVFMTFGIGYGDDIDKAKKVILEVSDRCPNLLPNRPTLVEVEALADSSVNFAVRPWTHPANYWDVHFFFHQEIKKAFDKEGISIPFPQMDVHRHAV